MAPKTETLMRRSGSRLEMLLQERGIEWTSDGGRHWRFSWEGCRLQAHFRDKAMKFTLHGAQLDADPAILKPLRQSLKKANRLAPLDRRQPNHRWVRAEEGDCYLIVTGTLLVRLAANAGEIERTLDAMVALYRTDAVQSAEGAYSRV